MTLAEPQLFIDQSELLNLESNRTNRKMATWNEQLVEQHNTHHHDVIDVMAE